MPDKIRIDKLLFEKGLAPSRERAQAYIMAGKVLADETKVEKAGQKVAANAQVRVLGVDQPYVSRGGLKLAEAITSFKLTIENRIAMDIGASTGGFTDCLLQHGAAFVFAIDTGYNQLDWKLVNDPRVRNLEKVNFRHMSMKTIGTFVDLIVIDVSFISLRKIIGNCLNFLVMGGEIVALVKPQFEAGRDKIKKGGLVDDPRIHQSIVAEIIDYSQSLGFVKQDSIYSPIQGKKSGNQEFLLHLQKPHANSRFERLG